MNTENTIYHIATLSEWATYQKKGVIEPTSLQTEGFIHCSTQEQLFGTIQRFYSFEKEIVLIELEIARFGTDLVFEDTYGHGAFPHIYRAIQIAEIVSAQNQAIG